MLEISRFEDIDLTVPGFLLLVVVESFPSYCGVWILGSFPLALDATDKAFTFLDGLLFIYTIILYEVPKKSVFAKKFRSLLLIRYLDQYENRLQRLLFKEREVLLHSLKSIEHVNPVADYQIDFMFI